VPSHSFSKSVDISTSQRALFIAAVVLIHVAVLGTWVAHPHVTIQPHEMSISMTMPTQSLPTPPAPEAVPQLPAQAKPQRVEKAVVASPVAATPIATSTPPAAVSTAAPVAPSAPALPDREPDFAAAYLNNPRPTYPTIADANHMRWEGRVILLVEVFTTGLAGEVSVYKSSGREVLDNAAIAAVKRWKFTPARIAGQVVTKMVRVPINFQISKEDE
jgi:periplasmic protein TonB